MLFDLPLEQLITYRPSRIEPEDFDLFWSQTLAEARRPGCRDPLPHPQLPDHGPE